MTPQQETQAASLMLRAQQGEEEAYAELLVLLTRATRNYVRSRIGPAAWMDDAVQETLVAVHHARHTYDGRRPFGPWFYAIARHRFLDVLRREQRIGRREVLGGEFPEWATAADEGASRVDMDAVRQALASLPPRQREIVEAMKLRDESVRDIAARMGMTMTSVKVTAHRGYRMLRCLLGVGLSEE